MRRALAVCLVLAFACSADADFRLRIGAHAPSGLPQAATPTCTPAAGSYVTAQTVTCSSTTPASTTRCTIDGSDPHSGSAVCTNVSVGTSLTLKAFAMATGYTDSAISSHGYTITGGGNVYLGITIPTTHPRLVYDDAAALAAARTWYATHNFAIDGSPGNDGFSRIWNLTHGLLSNSDAERRAVLDWAIPLNTNMPLTGTACDNCRWYGEAIILAYDWAHDLLTPAEKATFITEANEWITAWMNNVVWGTPVMVENNYNHGYLRNQILWGIASYEDNVTAAQGFLTNAITTRLTNNFYDQATYIQLVGGVGREGSQYGFYINGYSGAYGAAMTALGRDFLPETPYWIDSLYWHIYSTTPISSTWLDVGAGATRTGFTVFPFSEDETWLRASVIDFNSVDFMTNASVRWSASNAGQYARTWINLVAPTFQATWNPIRSKWSESIDSGSSALAWGTLPLDWYGSGSGHFIVRDTWTGANATIAHLDLKDGPSEGHSNADWGSWQVWRKGRFVSRESVSYGDTVAGWHGTGTAYANGPIGHNSFLINGVGTRGAANNTWWVDRLANVTRLETASGFAFASVNLNSLISDSNWSSWTRDFVWVRDLATLVVLDRVQSSAAGATKTFLMHCETNPTVASPVATCTTGTQSLRMTTLVPALPTIGVVTEGGAVGQYRIEVDDAPGVAASYILTVLQAKDSGGANLTPSVVDNGSTWTVTLDATHSVTLAKGMTSTGGSITISGSTTNFRAGVQPISSSTSGVTWGP